MKNHNVLKLLVLLFTVTLFSNCGQPRYETGRNFLVQLTDEEYGYGLYSYLLFKEVPNEVLMDKYKATLEVAIHKIPQIQDLQNYIAKDSLNVLYIPLIKEPNPGFVELSISEKSEWIIDNYDYARAKAFLNKFDEVDNAGPYIVSYPKALSRVGVVNDRYLIQDFSGAHPRVVPLWMDEFLKQSSKPTFWDESELNLFCNTLRNSIAVAADGLTEITESLSWWKDSLNDWIAVR